MVVTDSAVSTSPPQQIARQSPAFLPVDRAGPAPRLRFDIREHFSQRLEFDETVKGKRNGAALLCDDGGRGDNLLKRNLLRLRRCRQRSHESEERRRAKKKVNCLTQRLHAMPQSGCWSIILPTSGLHTVRHTSEPARLDGVP